jgi:cardiolipin synthase
MRWPSGRAGVRVTLVMDAIGSFGAFRKAAVRFARPGAAWSRRQKLAWYRLSRLNNRTHRELLVVDGQVAFIGGAGVADW